MMLRCCSNDDVGKPGRVSKTTRPVRQRTGDPRRCRIESENAITVQMQDRVEPSRQIRALARGAFAPQLGNSILYLRHRDSRHEQRG